MGIRFVRDAGLVFGILVGAVLGACGDVLGKSGTHREVLSTECVTCHRKDYEAAKNPPHVDQFPITCGVCHTETSWTPANYRNHPWPLTGAHETAPCGACHAGDPPAYKGAPTACVGCHQADYDSSPFPGHNTFPTTCENCHTTAAWKPATGGGHPEDRFPLTGPHAGIECMQCHNASLGPNGRDNADCVGCHTGEHTRARMDEKHKEVAGYPAGTAPPNFCLDCHPNGRKN